LPDDPRYVYSSHGGRENYQTYGRCGPDRQSSDRLIFEERRAAYITYIGTKTPIGPEGNSQISGFVNDPAIRLQIMWQGMLLNEMKRQKLELVDGIKGLIGEIDKELAP